MTNLLGFLPLWLSYFTVSFFAFGSVLSIPNLPFLNSSGSPEVELDYGVFSGTKILYTPYKLFPIPFPLPGVSTPPLDLFLGIPFAAPPIGELRLQRPKPPVNFTQLDLNEQGGGASHGDDGNYPNSQFRFGPFAPNLGRAKNKAGDETLSDFDSRPGLRDAKSFGPSCPQMLFGDSKDSDSWWNKFDGVPRTVQAILAKIPVFEKVADEDEDCLTINVIRPHGISSGADLPVLVWVFGGGFEVGGSATYDGSSIVARAMNRGRDLIFVSMNYRLNGFGFLPGKEVKQAGIGNLGLRDQQFALQWVQQYIRGFGGDPNKVTLWGESAGAMSAALHLLADEDEKPFRGVFMNSGSALPTGDIDSPRAQEVFDRVIAAAKCTPESSLSMPALECLRSLPFEEFKEAIQIADPGIFSLQSLNLGFLPRVDGENGFIPESSMDSLRKKTRRYPLNLPVVLGANDDEGTLFSFALSSITTDSEAISYLHENYASRATLKEVAKIAKYYPPDVTTGSPFDTGYLNQLTPQFKRVAAFQGDLAFQAPRRFFLDNYSGHLDNTSSSEPSERPRVWAFLNKRKKSTPFLGSHHGSDLGQYFTQLSDGEVDEVTREGQDYLINFVNNLNPNMPPLSSSSADRLIHWPEYEKNQSILLFTDPSFIGEGGLAGLSLATDSFRNEAISYLTELELKYPP